MELPPLTRDVLTRVHDGVVSHTTIDTLFGREVLDMTLKMVGDQDKEYCQLTFDDQDKNYC